MTNKVSFLEKQKIRQPWVWFIISGINLLFLFGFICQVILGHPLGKKPIDNTVLILLTLLVLFFFFLLTTCSLKTRITSERVYIKYFPFHWFFKSYKRNTIKHIEIIKRDPLRDFGGWGLRTGFFRKKNVFNISGKYGIFLEFENGSKIIIGTKKPEEIFQILSNKKY